VSVRACRKRRSRYKLPFDELIRRLRLGDLHRLFLDRCVGSVLPNDDIGRKYLRELLLPISLGPNEAVQTPGMVQIWGPDKKMRREIAKWAPWMDQNEIEELVQEIADMPSSKRKPKARTIGKRLQVTYPERQRLQLRTIGPCDMTERQLAVLRKQNKRRRNEERRQRRRLGGVKSRADYLASHKISRERPWIAQGISRRTYYYRIQQSQLHKSAPVKLTKTVTRPVQTGLGEVSWLDCIRLSTATPAVLSGTCANDGFMSADDAAWLVHAICKERRTKCACLS
jgi:hypothetical protein